MSTARRAARTRRIPFWARAIAAVITALGAFCLVYRLVFWFLWRFLFGEEVWPWPPWSLWLLVATASVAALATAAFMAVAQVKRQNTWIAAAIGSLALFGLIRYAGEVWKVMFQLGFKP